ncbi:serine/threonine-protein kinase [Marinicella meishanensis]|uniref:serine/threonine-protein kinase n=1 Tax=Marinicella meishanensis TaxID=2873263 RepID=UPI001CC17A9A|nr:serine/threonine-protein kinase [Marinicella sp. NBU2979]
MTPKDLEQLWQQINAELDQDEDIELDAYLRNKGCSRVELNALSDHTPNLINHTFLDADLHDQQLHNKYKIIQQIDSGGQSDIYLAARSDGVYQQTVVIKFISGQFDHPSLKQQFLQEMQLLADLRHPGVVTIIDGNITAQGKPWLVLDHIDGLHIDQHVKRHGLNTEGVVKLMMDLCETLQFVHNRQVFHKDLKPGNVLVNNINDVPYPVLIDFGIAMQQGDQVAMNFGTRGYSAPEQIKGQTVDQRTDLYALGVLFGHLLLTRQGQATALTHADDLRQAMVAADVPKDLRRVISKLTAVDPAKRYPSADALRSDLSLWQQGFPLSFDNHKLTAVVAKSVKRHPWVTLGLVMALVSAVFFTIKYTRDTHHLQQLTIAEKNATDELMNFMLDDLYENLERIGRIDVLQSVVNQSVDHLGKQDPLTLDQAGHLQAAKAYANTGRVFDYLEQSEQAQSMFRKAEKHLQQALEAGADPLDHLPLLANLKVYESQVLVSAGQEQATERVLNESILAMQQLLLLDPSSSQLPLWEASMELGYHYMEYARDESAAQVANTVAITQRQLANNPEDANWLYASSQSLQMKAWYELDYGELSQGITDLLLAIEHAQASMALDPEDLKKQHNQRILYNQLGFFYLEDQQLEPAQQAVLQAIELGDALKLKAPFNQEYEREHAYSYGTAGEISQQLGDLDAALRYYQFTLATTQELYAADPLNYSAANDLAVDLLLVADLQQQLGQTAEAQAQFAAVDALLQPVHEAEPNNKYYAHTLLVTKLQLQRWAEAKALYELAKSNDMVDGTVKALLAKHQLDWP